MNGLRVALRAAFLIAGITSGALAQEVTLRANEGVLEITGDLMDHDGEFYRIRTPDGPLTVDAAGVTCSGSGCPDPENHVTRIVISGARTMSDVLMPALLEAFARNSGMDMKRITRSDEDFTYVLQERGRRRDIARFTFHGRTSGEGFADLVAGEADMIMALRKIGEDEARMMSEAGHGTPGHGMTMRVIGLDGIVAVVSRENPLGRISPEDLARLFSGEIENWRDLGGPDAPIALHGRQSGSGLMEAFRRRVMQPAGKKIANGRITWHDSNADLVDAVAADPSAIGITSYSERGNAKALALAGRCGFEIRPTAFNLKSEDYPLTAPLFLYLPARRLPKTARDFVKFLDTEPAQRVVQWAGFVDLRPVGISMEMQGERLANAILAAGRDTGLSDLRRLVETMKDMRRHSITFRFEEGSLRLDAQSQANVESLSRLMEGGGLSGLAITLAGFTDGEGSAKANMAIAKKRAEAIRDALLARMPSLGAGSGRIKVMSFGEAMPMACNEEEWGRRVNRRIEVWIR